MRRARRCGDLYVQRRTVRRRKSARAYPCSARVARVIESGRSCMCLFRRFRVSRPVHICTTYVVRIRVHARLYSMRGKQCVLYACIWMRLSPRPFTMRAARHKLIQSDDSAKRDDARCHSSRIFLTSIKLQFTFGRTNPFIVKLIPEWSIPRVVPPTSR